MRARLSGGVVPLIFKGSRSFFYACSMSVETIEGL